MFFHPLLAFLAFAHLFQEILFNKKLFKVNIIHIYFMQAFINIINFIFDGISNLLLFQIFRLFIQINFAIIMQVKQLPQLQNIQ